MPLVEVGPAKGESMVDDRIDDRGETRRPRNARWRYTVPAVLLLLRSGPAHGYDLLARLPGVFPRAVDPADPGTFYRLLRSVEADGAVTSSWETGGAGPARRIYALTDVGLEQLGWWSLQIDREIEALTRFQATYRHTDVAPAPCDDGDFPSTPPATA